MSIPAGEFGAAAIVAAFALGVLGVSELLRKLGATKEQTRKTAHVGSGLLAAAFPYIFGSPWTVTIIAAGFFVVVAGSRHFGQLQGVHGVDRVSYGAQAFPVVIAVLFWLTPGQPALYVIPIAVLAVSDAAAALVGTAYGTRHFRALGERRSLEGSTAFFVVTFIVVHVPLLLYNLTDRVDCVLIALAVAFLATCIEAISVRGLDNVFIPLGVWYALDGYLAGPSGEIHVRRIVFLAGAAIFGILLRRRGFLTRTAGIGFMLIAYAAWAMGDWYWVLPLGGAFAGVLGAALALRRHQGTAEPLGLSHLFQVTITGVLVLFIFDQTQSVRWYLPFLAAVSAGGAVAVHRITAFSDRRPVWVIGAAAAPILLAVAWSAFEAVGLQRGYGPAWALGAGLLAVGLTVLAAPGAARFKCEECERVTDEPRHCGAVSKLVAGHRHWTVARTGWAATTVATVLVAFM